MIVGPVSNDPNHCRRPTSEIPFLLQIIRVMKAIRKGLKPIALLLTALLLMQSCIVYHKTPITLEKASQEHRRTKIKTADDKTYKFKYITHENGVFYGINKSHGKPVKTSLYNEEVTGVYDINDAASTLTTVTTIIGVPVVLLGLLYIAFAEGW